MKYGGYSCNEGVYPDHRANNWRHQIELVQLRNSFACLQLLLEITSPATILWKSADNIPAPDLFRLLPVYVEKHRRMELYGGSGDTGALCNPSGTILSV